MYARTTPQPAAEDEEMPAIESEEEADVFHLDETLFVSAGSNSAVDAYNAMHAPEPQKDSAPASRKKSAKPRKRKSRQMNGGVRKKSSLNRFHLSGREKQSDTRFLLGLAQEESRRQYQLEQGKRRRNSNTLGDE